MKRIFSLVFFALLIGSAGQCMAEDNILSELQNFRKREVRFEGFVLDETQNVSVKVIASGRRHPVWTRAWILNSETREKVWDMRHATTRDEDRSTTTYTDNIDLPKGTYEVYYGTSPFSFSSINGLSGLIDFLGDEMFHWDDDNFSGDLKDLSIVVTGKGTRLNEDAVKKLQTDYKKNSFFSMSGLWDNQYEHQGFVLDKPTDLKIYALGELRNDGSYDYGWIKNVKTNTVVWTMKDKDLDYAGGDRKNRMVNETISLPAGSYAAFFVTDDSHSAREWNAPPPYDPEFWGMTVRVVNSEMAHNARLTEYEDLPSKNIIVDMTRVRDKEYRSKGFTLRRGMDVRVFAIGEGKDGEMYDYGWITDARTNTRVWEMKYRETEHAGGAEKNRMVDKVIHLDKGSYMAYYVSDGSHNYHDWNAAPPYDQEHWGITVLASDDNFAANDVAPYDDQSNKSVIARIIRVGDDERRQKSFTLQKETEVRIYALGEGRDGEMYDYGWIEEEPSGKTVWEMTYRMTDNAGGAQKNRRFDGTITLKPGEYSVHYRSDDSHSFDDWNDDPPSDPFNWGITLYNAAPTLSGNDQ